GSSAFFSYGNAGNSNDIASSFTAPLSSRPGGSQMGRFLLWSFNLNNFHHKKTGGKARNARGGVRWAIA
ncbi:hypothetical protein, partial [Escherichia coli]|uniref:hypothetical protein n=1 Tax=Escherichia coli TaxID=562 RepID=UPI00228039D3